MESTSEKARGIITGTLVTVTVFMGLSRGLWVEPEKAATIAVVTGLLCPLYEYVVGSD
jgi:hypothetical protein